MSASYPIAILPFLSSTFNALAGLIVAESSATSNGTNTSSTNFFRPSLIFNVDPEIVFVPFKYAVPYSSTIILFPPNS